MHSIKSKSRHPDAKRQKYLVGHVTFELCSRKENGQTFALIAGDAIKATDRRPLFTGHLNTQMPAQLRQLAHAIEDILK